MLSLFPTLFDYGAVAVGILRIVVAIIFIAEGYKRLPRKGAETTFFRNLIPIVEMTLGTLFLVGLFTQAVAVALATVSVKQMFAEYKHKSAEERNLSFYILLFFISLSFLFWGPGLWSIDYPL